MIELEMLNPIQSFNALAAWPETACFVAMHTEDGQRWKTLQGTVSAQNDDWAGGVERLRGGN